jgi:nitrite reductase/ring-hydroxylating ferredoxin subunit
MGKKVLVCHISKVKKDKPFVFNLNSQEQVTIFKTQEGYFAVENSCPHAGAFLNEGMVTDNILTCIWHGWRFDLETGQSLNEYWARLKTYPLKIDKGNIYIENL